MSESPPPQYRCSTCKSITVNRRNLAVFIDGTANKPGPQKTNVLKLYEIMSDGEGQHKLYLEGIGTDELDGLYSVGKMIYNGLDMATAMSVEQNVKRAYRWLAEIYHDGDQIYLFGFSRGAYQVRALAGMIHEVGLVTERSKKRINQAYRRYISIDPNNPKTSESAVEFKQSFCRPGVRIHFIGVWDTVSSLGLIKQDVHITASASVTNACHFRHALALDERRVNFAPEYFVEVNALRSSIRSPRMVVSDVKEVWFAGCHGDVGGVSRSHIGVVPNPLSSEDAVHAGNVPLVWMGREAAAKGLTFDLNGFYWNPEDVDLGRVDSMKWYWGILEVLPVRHQVAFSGTGKHKLRQHWFYPRIVIPGQQIHLSVSLGNVYATQATLSCGVEIPTVPQKASDGLWLSEPWTTELMDEEATTSLLTSLLNDKRKTLQCLGGVLFLLNYRLDRGQNRVIPTPAWLKESIEEPFGLDEAALAVIDDVISNFSTPEGRRGAMNPLSRILRSPESSSFPRALYILSFIARHQTLRRRFISHEVIRALMVALERTARSRNEGVFPLVTDSLCYIIDDEQHRNNVIDQLFANGIKAWKTRLSLALAAKAPSHLVASLKLIALVAQYQPGPCERLRPEINNLATEGGSPVASAAVGTLVKLVRLATYPYNIPFSNILGYLANTLPRLDAEIGSDSSPCQIVDLPPVLKVNGSGRLDEKVMGNFVSLIQSWNDPQRTAATLTLLKLINNPDVQGYCSRKKVLEIFMEQLKTKETSLLAAYALRTCLKHNDMWKVGDYSRAAYLIVGMVDKGWFDDAVGRVEGAEIFRGLMKPGDLRREVIHHHILAKLEKKLEIGNHHETRMSLICLEIIWQENPADLTRKVTESLDLLKDLDVRNQKRGIKTLSSLAQTGPGEHAIKSRLTDIVKMLLPVEGAPPPRHQLFAATAVLYKLCKNETLREKIHQSRGFAIFVDLRRNGTLYP